MAQQHNDIFPVNCESLIEQANKLLYTARRVKASSFPLGLVMGGVAIVGACSISVLVKVTSMLLVIILFVLYLVVEGNYILHNEVLRLMNDLKRIDDADALYKAIELYPFIACKNKKLCMLLVQEIFSSLQAVQQPIEQSMNQNQQDSLIRIIILIYNHEERSCYVDTAAQALDLLFLSRREQTIHFLKHLTKYKPQDSSQEYITMYADYLLSILKAKVDASLPMKSLLRASSISLCAIMM